MKSALTKTAGKISQVDLISKLFNHLEDYKFWSNSSKVFSFNGEMVKSHLKNEWILSNVITANEPVFHTSLSVDNEFNNVLELAQHLPFSIVEITHSEDDHQPHKYLQLNSSKRTILRKSTFCFPESSINYFHKQQRERKIWWRKFSAQPSRFGLTEVITNEKKEQSVQISAELPWDTETVESVKYLKEPTILNSESCQLQEGRKVITPHVVINELELEMATFTYLCDAYDKLNEDTARDLMRFHRKLAPFKITFVANATTASVGKDLSDLALLLAKKIRKLGIPCLLLPDMTKKSMESQFLRADAMGVPYSIVLNDKTLQEGMIGIRSRDTTLKEQSHVSIVVQYVEKLMKNY